MSVKKRVKKKTIKNSKTPRQTKNSDENCSFCGKSKQEVNHLIKGDDGYICDACVASCVGVLDKLKLTGDNNQSANSKTRMKYIHEFVRKHFYPLHTSELITATREFPLRMRVDIQCAFDKLLGDYYNSDNFTGIHASHSYEGIKFTDLLQEGQYAPTIAPPRYDEIDIGDEDAVSCLNNGLWIGTYGDTKFSILLSYKRDYSGGGSTYVEIIVPPGETGNKIVRNYFNSLEVAVNEAGAYRGKVLSLEREHPYSGKSTEILVHKLPAVYVNDIILPNKTLQYIEKDVVGFSAIKSQLIKLELPIKKGVLFYGPPGTGKTHSVKYIANKLKHHTTLLITADQVAYIGEYMLLARLLQPSIVVIEDVDLIAKERDKIRDASVESLLNKLLNEMDGLKENIDVFFILTTNRPDVLEEALAERPGRIDQAIEFPLPDDDGRRRLAQLYAKALPVSEQLFNVIVDKTKDVSAAFIKELMRRVAQNLIIDKSANSVTLDHVNGALEDMLFASGRLKASIGQVDTQ